ncbi:MAG: hypothetical protein ACKVRN_14945 [Pyrinomonadaceae bacterium]
MNKSLVTDIVAPFQGADDGNGSNRGFRRSGLTLGYIIGHLRRHFPN